MQYNSCYKCGRALTSGEVDGLCLDCKSQLSIPALCAQISALRAENAKLEARVEAAEALIKAQEDFDAAVGLPECWRDEKEYQLDVGKLTARLQAAREKWSALK